MVTDSTVPNDVEKGAVDNGSELPTYNEKRPSVFDKEEQIRRGSITPQHDSFFSAFTPHSFKRNPNARVVTEATDNEGRPLEDQPPAEPALAMKLKGRHLQMIAIGGSIGTGLFVGSGSALATGGPASLVLAYGLIGIMLYCTVHALGEMAVLFPIAGAFSVYSTRFIDPAWGFAMGWNYALNWLVTLPLELTAASITLSFWPGAANVNPAAWVIIFWVAVVLINFFGVKGYGEAEFIFSIIKVAAVIGFCILGIIIAAGGVPGSPQGYLGTHYWYDPGAFNHGFKGLCSVFTTAAFSFGGTELVGLTAAETENPRKTLPTAVKQVFWRICLFYMVSLTIVGCIVPYNDPDLLNGSSSSDAKASPFVIAVNNAKIIGVPSIMNAVILISVLSVGNSSIYGSSRTMAALADRGQAPKILGYIDNAGRPLVSIILASVIGLLCFICAAGSDTRTQAFNWMLAISGLSSIFTWASINACHIRFRAAWKYNGKTVDELPFKSQPGIIGSWIGLIFNILILIVTFWVGFAPVGYASMSTGELVKSWFEAYLSFPIILVCYLGFKIWKRTSFKRIKDIDITSGRRDLDLATILAEEPAAMLVEEQRFLHEDLERLEQAIAERVAEDPKNVRFLCGTQPWRLAPAPAYIQQIKDRLNRDHQINNFLTRIQDQSRRLLDLYKDADGARMREVQSLSTGDQYDQFYKELEKVKEHHRQYPNEPVDNLERAYKRRRPDESVPIVSEVDNMFTGEEGNGRFLDLTSLHENYLNLPGVKRLTYIQYLDNFDAFEAPRMPIKRGGKVTDKYFNYVAELDEYLEGFIRRTRPLDDHSKYFLRIDREFDTAWEKGEVPGWPKLVDAAPAGPQTEGSGSGTWCAACEKEFNNANVYKAHLTGKKHIRYAEAKQKPQQEPNKATNGSAYAAASTSNFKERIVASHEHRIRAMADSLSNERSNTRVNIYNPLKLPLAWDGKPIPYWLYKLHGLGIEFSCEICGNFVYMGRRAFDKHFSEARHIYGLKCLGITNTSGAGGVNLFREITGINEALALWDKLKKDKREREQKEDSVVQMEDGEGNVMPERIYHDLQKQGIL
ncbi:hypothetical protein DV736_g3214, partial [Chaetothyriales sp. CBS 134916]